MEQTAVEWLVEQLKEQYPITLINSESLFDQAKAMEQAQLDAAWQSGLSNGLS